MTMNNNARGFIQYIKIPPALLVPNIVFFIACVQPLLNSRETVGAACRLVFHGTSRERNIFNQVSHFCSSYAISKSQNSPDPYSLNKESMLAVLKQNIIHVSPIGRPCCSIQRLPISIPHFTSYNEHLKSNKFRYTMQSTEGTMNKNRTN